jgi:signal transduction histidine kinase
VVAGIPNQVNMATPSAVPTVADRRAARPPRLALLWAIAVAGLAVATLTIALGLTNDEVSNVQVALLVWISIPYVATGLVAWWRRPESRLGVLMVAGGFVSALSALQFAQNDALYTVGTVFDILPAAVFLHVYLAFPDGRLKSRFERILVATAYATAVGPQLAKISLGEFGSDIPLAFWDRPDLALTVARVQLLSLSAMCLAGVGVLAARQRRAGRPRRRSVALLIDSFALGLVMIAVLFVVGSFEGLAPAFVPIQRATLVVLGISPIAFLIGLLDARLARSAVGDLFIELRTDPAPADLRDALARALRDPSLTLAFWLPDFRSYADLDGRAVDVPGQDDDRATTLIDRNGSHVAALLHDPALNDEPALLDSVSAAAGIALENARLHAELRARLDELRGSRARVIEAGQKERQRLERNLHDGAQQRLVALSLELGLLEERLAGDPDARTRLDQARREIATSLEELRDVARGIHPAVVSGHGLAIALEQLAARAPLPVRLKVKVAGRLPERVEVAAYYLVSESLANIGKHAHATSATVAVDQADGQVVVEVVDDGVGGADTERGSGLRGLADRIEALGGRLRIWSPPGGGTRMRAEIPCAS